MEDFKMYITYDKKGDFQGFYDDEELIIKNFPDFYYNLITKKVYDTILTYGNKIYIHFDKINKNTIINSMDYITLIKPSFNLNKKKQMLIHSIKQECKKYIIEGKIIEIPSDKEIKQFTYKIEDQINLRNILDNYRNNETIYYHASGEFDTLYSYEDILQIYKELENNKNYNLIYTDCLCQWIDKNYTEELYQNKEYIITYGFATEELIEEVEQKYAKQLL